jgi:ABC-type multidrug transport system fused ATPase/permease subunit
MLTSCSCIDSILLSFVLELGAITILYALSITQALYSMIRHIADFSTYMTSAERAMGYTQIPPEPGQYLPEFTAKKWPNAGEVKFQSVSLRYYKGGPEILKNISFKVNPKEKIGIAGRTGAGKSSLVAALMRLSLTEGNIFVNGLNIREMNVASSRQLISVISQTPILINGTIRVNLDPLGEHRDSEIWKALAKTKMTSAISNLPKKLDNEINSGDSDFSLGERQLLHLTRVLLKKNEIIIFDEATGKVDRKTDEDIQSVVRDVFKDRTVITIAHRLSTILNSDRIMILDQGNIVDSGTPQALLNREDSLLKQLLELSPEN